ncbi:glycosyltransferase [Luteimicrobium subarcticum]|uniref:Glycosyl transferase family 1 n=1 Tax=Luteimicrobium subarcticum TaxID=620910 RepID=A0A2M8WUW6_9MICO|nr:glycosyltransferase [Luteimicrobium subarcticum]PJI94720.1 glycosyl transferase family 1 [Luteimicrobium subarcticum]
MTKILRLLPQLRENHLDGAGAFGDGRVNLYLRLSYETTGAPGPEFVKVDARGLIRAVWASDARLLETWEPLWMRYLPLHVAVVATWRAAGVVRRGRGRPIVAHAMENARLVDLIGAGRRVPALVERTASVLLGAYVHVSLSRIAYATPDAEALYRGLPGAERVEARLVLDLPSPCVTASGSGTGVVFLGQLAEHKGVRDLMAAWTTVEAADPKARLVLVGGGPLADEVAAWCALRPLSRKLSGPLRRDDALVVVRDGAVLVLPSRRRRRWREQVGLPIREGLRQGRTIVASDGTGLAPWLRAQGHHVVREGDVRALADALLAATARPLAPRAVLATLPDLDSRESAALYLYGALGASVEA